MNRHVNAIVGRLSLRSPQRQSLEILDRITEIVPPKKDADVNRIINRPDPGVCSLPAKHSFAFFRRPLLLSSLMRDAAAAGA